MLFVNISHGSHLNDHFLQHYLHTQSVLLRVVFKDWAISNFKHREAQSLSRNDSQSNKALFFNYGDSSLFSWSPGYSITLKLRNGLHLKYPQQDSEEICMRERVLIGWRVMVNVFCSFHWDSESNQFAQYFWFKIGFFKSISIKNSS